MGDKFTVADAYLFTVVRWSPRVASISANGPTYRLSGSRRRRPKVQEAMKAEGLLQ